MSPSKGKLLHKEPSIVTLIEIESKGAEECLIMHTELEFWKMKSSRDGNGDSNGCIAM